jgi:hypothetical protein
LTERLRAARRIPQAIVKVTSFSKGTTQAKEHFQYISRKGVLEIETDQSEVLIGRDKQMKWMDEWVMDFDSNKNSRDTANIVFSMPPGSRVESLKQAVRATAKKAFPDHEWAFAIHEDQKHPHAHLMLKMRGLEKKIRLRKAELYQLRELFAESAREVGVPLAVSPRIARGIAQKPMRQAIYHIKQRGDVPLVEQKAKSEAAREIMRGALSQKPWERSIQKQFNAEKSEYIKNAALIRQAALKKPLHEKEKLLKAADDLEVFAKSLSKPQTRREIWVERVKKTRSRKVKFQEKLTSAEMER